jgi:hypothetical protein
MPCCLIALCITTLPGPFLAEVAAQTSDRGYVSVKAGGNIERAEDGLAGESAGVGVDAGVVFSAAGASTSSSGCRVAQSGAARHRDILFNVSAVKFFGTTVGRSRDGIGARARPGRALFGRLDSNTSYVVGGGGVRCRLADASRSSQTCVSISP